MRKKFVCMDDFYGDLYEELFLGLIHNGRDGLMRYGYALYMYEKAQGTLPIELDSIENMAFDTRVKVDALNNAIYYFETIGDSAKANDMIEIKQIIQNNFRNMVILLKINKPQFN